MLEMIYKSCKLYANVLPSELLIFPSLTKIWNIREVKIPIPVTLNTII